MSFERTPEAKATTTTSRAVIVKPAETIQHQAGTVLTISDGPDGSAGWRTLLNGTANAGIVPPASTHDANYTPPVFQWFRYDSPAAGGVVTLDAIYTMRGLIPGRKYTVTAKLQSDNANNTVTLMAGGQSAPVYSPPPFATRRTFLSRSVTFTATGDEGDIVLRVVRVNGAAFKGERHEARFAGLTVTAAAYTQNVPAVLSDQVEFPILDGAVTLDAGWTPYVQGTAKVPIPTSDAAAEFDPNRDTRFKITASSLRGEVAQWGAWTVERRNYVPDVELTRGSTTLAGGRGTAFNIFQLATGSATSDARNTLFARDIAGQREQVINLFGLKSGEKFGVTMPLTETAAVVGGALSVGVWPDRGGPQDAALKGELTLVMRLRNVDTGTVYASKEGVYWRNGFPVSGDWHLADTANVGASATRVALDVFVENRGTVEFKLPTSYNSTPLTITLGKTTANTPPALYLNDAIPADPWPDEWISTVAPASDAKRYVKGARSTVRETRKPAAPIVDVLDRSTFDLALTSKSIDYAAGTMTLDLASDEYLAQRYAPVADDKTPRSREASLRSVCEYVLGKAIPTVPVLAGTADAAVTAFWGITNEVSNPRAANNVAEWRAGGGTSAVAQQVMASPLPPVGNTAVRITANDAQSNLVPNVGQIRVTPGEAYTFSFYGCPGGTGRSARAVIQWWTANGVKPMSSTFGTLAALPAGAFTRYTVTGIAPPGAESAMPYASTLGNTNGALNYATMAMFYQGDEVVPYFDGATPPGSGYTYAWSSDSHASASSRQPVVERAPSLLTWSAGTSAWDFLSTLANAVGLRLFCDETRTWQLVDPATYTRAGSITANAGTTLDAEDTVDGERGAWADGVVITWKWRDPITGDNRVQVETAGTAGKVDTLDIESPYPGPGTAAARLATLRARGAERPLTIGADFRARPAQSITSTITGAPTKTGRIGSVKLDLSTGLMLVQPDKLT